MTSSSLESTAARSSDGHTTFAFGAFVLVLVSMAATYATVVATTRPMGLLSTATMVFLFVTSWVVLWLTVELAWMRTHAGH